MKRWSWRGRLGLLLIVLTVALFGLHYLIFGDLRTLAFYEALDVAFLPLQLLVVTLIINELLENRVRQERLHKLNMVIGAFFSEVGNELLRRLTAASPDADAIRASAWPSADWDARAFLEAARRTEVAPSAVRLSAEDLRELRDFLVGKRDFLLRLLENPNLLEHESFTDLLWAVFHLAEELESRTRFVGLPATDTAHLDGDAERAYTRLLGEWIRHARHLKESYPYLYSLLVRTNPLDPAASAEVTS